MTDRSTRATNAAPRQSALARAVEQYRGDFVGFVRKRVQDAAAAEDIVNETLGRALSHVDELRDEKVVVAWLYSALRNAVVDHYRKRAASGRALAQWALEATTADEGPIRRTVCPCVKDVAAGLKPEYAQALERIEVGGEALRQFATEVGISPSNAAVRVFRAREALRRGVISVCGACARDRCVDCTCAAPEPAGHRSD